MLLAQLTDGQITRVAERAEYAELANPPLQPHLDALGLVQVIGFRPHDPLTQKLVACDPVLESGIVYNVQVASKSEEEIAADKAEALLRVKGIRNSILSSTDWSELPGALARVGSEKIEALLVYRQAVWARVVTLVEKNEDPRNFTDWPVAP